VLGPVGRNFGAGMSGGIAYVLDADGRFEKRCNLDMIELEPVRSPEDVRTIEFLLERHAAFTRSPVARRILSDFDAHLPRFVKVMPKDYKRALADAAKLAPGTPAAGAAEAAPRTAVCRRQPEEARA